MLGFLEVPRRKTLLLYLHIPFCDSKCHYCAFNSYVDKFHLKKGYIKSVTIQLKKELENLEKKSIKSIFIGGGTPSTVEPCSYEEFFETIKPYLKDKAEITSEANPNSATLDWLKGMNNLGVTRISFGIQSFSEKKLKILGRNHSSRQALRAIEDANRVGFENISIDLIYATTFDDEKDLKIALELPINHISSYALTLEENTPFFGKNELVDESEKCSREFIEKISSNFPQYEISNFGTYQSVHNLGYWRGEDYLGIGSGAVGFKKDKRYYPSKSIEEYIKNPLKKEVEVLTEENLRVERIFLGLRCIVGVDLEVFTQKEMQKVELLLKERKLTCKANRVYNNDFLVADEIALYIIS